MYNSEKTRRPAEKNQVSKAAADRQNSGGISLMPPALQFKKGGSKDEEEEDKVQMKKASSPEVLQKKTGGGSSSALPDGVRSKMENSLGADFSNVNIHKNSSSATDVGALAYTQGNNVHFAPGQFKPDTRSGQELIGHELTHVVQQRAGRVQATTQAKGGMPVNDDKGLEAEADRMGAAAARGETVTQQKSKNVGTAAAGQVRQNFLGGLFGKMFGSKKSKDKINETKTNAVTLPETLGKSQGGKKSSIAVKGKGDKHAFSPNDVNQGSIGDCYFLATLVSVANTDPGALKKAIKKNRNGTFTVKLHRTSNKGASNVSASKVKDLTPVYITLYPTFPVSVDAKDTANANASSVSTAHAKGGDKNKHGQAELWVRLIEKAFALMMGSYKKIGSGEWSSHALEIVTGKPYKENFSTDTKSRKERIIEMVKAGIPTTVTTQQSNIDSASTAIKTFAQNNSIVAPHVYSVISADSKKIVIRNPWGEGARNAQPTLTWTQFDALFNSYADRQGEKKKK